MNYTVSVIPCFCNFFFTLDRQREDNSNELYKVDLHGMLLNVIDGCICKNQLWSLIEKITSSCIFKVWDKVIYRTNRNESAILWK